MNPDCQEELFKDDGDIIEKAHISPFYEGMDNSFENLIVLCPNCHTNFDKNSAFTPEKVKTWKQLRQQMFESVFSKKYATFEELSADVSPLLLQNKIIYEHYYLQNKKELWDNVECKILTNNRKLRNILENNCSLIQDHSNKGYSNLELIHLFLEHIDEFEITRPNEEKHRDILFPPEINSMFGVSPVESHILPSVESLEMLITKLQNAGKFKGISIGTDNPYIELTENGKSVQIFLNDTPRLRQIYFDYKCFKKATVRLESLNYALKYINSRGKTFQILNYNNLRKILVNKVKIIFVYEYCLSKVFLVQLSPEANSVVVNLHNWNGENCISKEACDFSKSMNVTLLAMDDFYGYINKL